MKKYKVDVLIVGTGVAGLYSAINLRSDLNIMIITKTSAKTCNTYLAQGGISKAKDLSDMKLFIEDTIKAGMYKNNEQAVKVLAEESIENIQNLTKLGVNFDNKGSGFSYTKEGAHRISRIVHCKDETGKAVFENLYNRVKERQNIKILENTCLIDIINDEGTCTGGVALYKNNVINISSKVTILACGGIGKLFKNSTNQKTIEGNGIAIALRNNVYIQDLNYIQFHPTALYDKNSTFKRFLISESVRGEGGKLININGERFVDELLPRNVVTQAIKKELIKTNSDYVYLDVTHLDKKFIKKRFPLIYSECLKRRLDITKEKIPVIPTQHYLMGGIKVDLFSKTSMENLYACGETSCTGVHGANRLASNSLLEGLVFSKRAADQINKNIDNIKVKEIYNQMSYEEGLKLCKENIDIVIRELTKVGGDIINELDNSR